MELTEEDIKRFWSKVDKKGENECWNWTACLFSDGYGQFSLHYKTLKAHRFSYYIKNNNLPIKPLIVRHKCKKNRKCVNPNHLEEGTYSQNNGEDKKRDKTQARGETNGSSKLTEIQVREIRQKYIPHKYTQPKLAEEYGVHISIISDIVYNKIWKHIL